MQNFIQSKIGSLFDTKGNTSEGEVLTPEKGCKENAVMFFSLQPLAFPAYADTIGKLIINDIKSYAASQLTAGTATPMYVILDEFSIFAGDQVINLINQGREAGIHALLSTQSLSDLEQAKGKPGIEQHQ
ncbi:MAG: TraM recognition domain-containing protein [Gammaproteobacteria bacterium]